MIRLKYSIWIFIVLISVTSLFSSQKKVVDNLTIFDQLTESLVKQIVDSTDSENLDMIFIKNAASKTNNDWYIENWFIKVLEKDDRVPFLMYNQEPVEISNNAAILEYKTKQLKVQYQGQKRLWWIKSIKRSITVELEFKVYNIITGEIYKFDNIIKNYSDIIKKKDFKYLYNENITFTQAAIHSDDKYKKIFEPIFVIATTGIVIYLFYSLRSK